jgi:hypothetical protein
MMQQHCVQTMYCPEEIRVGTDVWHQLMMELTEQGHQFEFLEGRMSAVQYLQGVKISVCMFIEPSKIWIVM